MDIVLDTNALLLPFTEGTDLEGELELQGSFTMVVPSSVTAELDQLARGTGKTGAAARGAKRYMTRCRIEKVTLPGDDGLLELARRLNGAVLTGDKLVQKEAKKSELPVYGPRAGGKLMRVY
jgi:rRNA-processing protein FCF1